MVDVAKLSISITTAGAKTAVENLKSVKENAEAAETAVKELGKIDAEAFSQVSAAITNLGTGLGGIQGLAAAFAGFGDNVTRPLGKLNSALISLGGAQSSLNALALEAKEANTALLELATAPVDQNLKSLAKNIDSITTATSSFSAKNLNTERLRTAQTAFGNIGTKSLMAAESIELFGQFIRDEGETLKQFSTNVTNLAAGFDTLVGSTRRLRRVSAASIKSVKEISKLYGEMATTLTNAFNSSSNLSSRLNAIGEAQDKITTSGQPAASTVNRLGTALNEAAAAASNYRASVGQTSRTQSGLNTSLKNGTDAFSQVEAGAARAASGLNRARNGFRGLQDTARRTNNFLKQFATGLGVIGGGFAVARAAEGSISTLFDFEFALQQVRAVAINTNQTLSEQEAQFVSLSDQARELGATTRFTATQTAEAQLFLARAGFEVNEILDATPATLNLAAAGVLDLGEAADIASNVLQQFSLNASQLGDVTDDLVSAANNSNTTVRQLADALNYAGPFAASLGLRVQDAAAAVGALGNAGIKSSLAGTNLRGILISLLKPSKEAGDILDKLAGRLDETREIFDVTNNSLADIFEAFRDAGASAEDFANIFNRRNVSGAQALTGQIESLRELQEVLGNNAGEAQRTADLVDNSLRGAYRRAVSAVQEFVLAVGDGGAKGALRGFLDTATETFRVLAGISSVTDETSTGVLVLKESLVALTGAAAAVTATAILSFFGSIATTAFKAATAANGLAASLVAVVRSFPPLALAGVIGAVGTLAIRFTESLDPIRNFKEESRLIKKALDDFAPSADRATDAVSDFFETLKKARSESSAETFESEALGKVIADAKRAAEETGKLTQELSVAFEKLEAGVGQQGAVPVRVLPIQALEGEDELLNSIVGEVEGVVDRALEQIKLADFPIELTGGFTLGQVAADGSQALERLADEAGRSLQSLIDGLERRFSDEEIDPDLVLLLTKGLEEEVLKFATEGFGIRLADGLAEQFKLTPRDIANFNAALNQSKDVLSKKFTEANFEQVVRELVVSALIESGSGLTQQAADELTDLLVAPLDLSGRNLENFVAGPLDGRFQRSRLQLAEAVQRLGQSAVEGARESFEGLPKSVELPFQVALDLLQKLTRTFEQQGEAARNQLKGGADLGRAEEFEAFKELLDEFRADVQFKVDVSGADEAGQRLLKLNKEVEEFVRKAAEGKDFISESDIQRNIAVLQSFVRSANEQISRNESFRKEQKEVSKTLEDSERKLRDDIRARQQEIAEIQAQITESEKLTAAQKQQFEIQDRLSKVPANALLSQEDRVRKANIERLTIEFVELGEQLEENKAKLEELTAAEKAFSSTVDSLRRGVDATARRTDLLQAQIDTVRGLSGELNVQAEFERRVATAQKEGNRITEERRLEILELSRAFVEGKKLANELAAELRGLRADQTLLANLREERAELGLRVAIIMAATEEEKDLLRAKQANAEASKLSAFATKGQTEEAIKLSKEIDLLTRALEGNKGKREQLNRRVVEGAQVNSAFAQNLADVILSAKSAEEAISGFVDQIARLVLQRQILNAIDGFGEKLFGGLLQDTTEEGTLRNDAKEATGLLDESVDLSGITLTTAGQQTGQSIAQGGTTAGTILLKAAAALQAAAASLASSGFSLASFAGVPFGTSIPGIGTVLGPGIGDPTGGSFTNPFARGGVIRQYNRGGIPPLGGLPAVGSDPALFRTPDGRLNSIRENGKPEAILPLGRDSQGRLGVRIAGDTRSRGPNSNTTNNVTQISNYSVSTNPDSFGMNERQLQRKLSRRRR